MENNLNKQRIIVNKYTDSPIDIIKDAFYSGYGEVIISIKKGEEGIYAKNDANEVVKLTASEVFIEQLIENERERAISAETAISNSLQELNNNIDSIVEEIVNKNISELGSSYHQDLTKTQYDELVKNGEITIKDKDGNDKIIHYSEDVYYMIYEEE